MENLVLKTNKHLIIIGKLCIKKPTLVTVKKKKKKNPLSIL